MKVCLAEDRDHYSLTFLLIVPSQQTPVTEHWLKTNKALPVVQNTPHNRRSSPFLPHSALALSPHQMRSASADRSDTAPLQRARLRQTDVSMGANLRPAPESLFGATGYQAAAAQATDRQRQFRRSRKREGGSCGGCKGGRDKTASWSSLLSEIKCTWPDVCGRCGRAA